MRRWIFFTVLSLLVAPMVQGRGDQEPCAWLTIDEAGKTWVNGEPAALEYLKGFGCTEKGEFVVFAPEFGTPADSVFRMRTELQELGVDLQYFLPSTRHVLVEIFGFDTLEDCAELTQYAPPPIVLRNTLEFEVGESARGDVKDTSFTFVVRGAGTKVSVKVVNDEGETIEEFRDIVALEEATRYHFQVKRTVTDGEVSWGIVDYVAEALWPLADKRMEFRLDVDPPELIVIDSDKNVYTPLPKLVRRRVVGTVDGESIFEPPSHEDLNSPQCPYARPVKESD